MDLDPNEVIEADDETLPYAEEDWQDPEQRKVPKNLEPDLPFTIQDRQNDRTRSKKKYNPYDDEFVVDRIDLNKIGEEVVGLEGMDQGPVETRKGIRLRATGVLRTRSHKSACLGVAERNDIRPQRDKCHDSRCRS